MNSLINISEYLPVNQQSRLTASTVKTVERLFKINHINTLYREIQKNNNQFSFSNRLLQELNIELSLNYSNEKISQIEGPIIFVSNHPFGALDGIILTSVLEKLRPDFKILVNRFLGQIKELRDNFILVDAFKPGSRENMKPMKDSLKWLKEGHSIGIFPAGEVSHYQPVKSAVTDPDWNTHIAKLAKKTNATIIPLYFEGRNSILFQVAGLIHPTIRTALLPRELLNKKNKTVQIHIGESIKPSMITKFEDENLLTSYIRLKTYTLSMRRLSIRNEKEFELKERIIRPVTKNYLNAEFERLRKSDALLYHDKQFEVYCCKSDQIPWILTEIGRLREETFRLVGEGTGHSIDIDEFDYIYNHLFIWDKVEEEIVGAYRLGESDRILKHMGKDGLYTSTLFNYKKKFIKSINPALELGRSFVQKKYQKQYQSLLLLWKGICLFISNNPQYRYLFGPVSISNSYHDISKDMMSKILKTKVKSDIKGKSPLKPISNKEYIHFIKQYSFSSIQDLSLLVSGFESDQKDIPVLLKQYLKLGGEIISFNVDPDFNDALDGLILLDVHQIPKKLLKFYMGKEKAHAYLQQIHLKIAN